MKLLFDEMVRNTAGWARIFGINSAYVHNLDDDSIMDIAKNQKRVLITRDKLLATRCKKSRVKAILLTTTDVFSQLCTIKNALNLKFTFPDKTRCPECNHLLHITKKEKISYLVPKNILKRHRKFWYCQTCNKAYWEGSHWKNIKKMFRRISRC